MNAQMLPHTLRKSPWRFAALALGVLGALIVLFDGVWPVALLGANASLGVIGGADGPTAIFVTSVQSAQKEIGFLSAEMLIGVLLLLAGVAGYFLLRRCPRKKDKEE